MTAPEPTVQPNELIPPLTCLDCGFPTLYVATIAHPDGTSLGTTLVCTHCRRHPQLAGAHRPVPAAGRDKPVFPLAPRRPGRGDPRTPMRRSA